MTKAVALSCFFLLSTFSCLHSQSFYRWEKDKRLSFIAGFGLNNYYGELNDRHRFSTGDYNLSLGLQYPLLAQAKLKAEAMYYRISGSDQQSESVYRQARNLSFRGQNFDFSMTLAWTLFQENPHNEPLKTINPYILFGIGFTYFNPEAKYEGKWHALRPLKTEGVAYNPFSLVFPVGGGITYNITPDMALLLEATYRFTQTDFLDDVSMTYALQDPQQNPIAAALADRGPEIGHPAIEPGTPRGNPSTNDGFLTVNLKLSHKIGAPKPAKRIQMP